MKFKSNIESQAGIEDSAGSAGDLGQILSSLGSVAGVDGIGWIDQADVVAAGATRVLIACKNTSGATITKGTPVYQTGNVGATDVIEIAEADALISTGYLPAIGLLEIDLINNALGHVVITGELLNYSTADIPTDRPGGDPFTGDTVYLAAGGGLTCIKPTGAGNAIQNLGLVGKVSVGNAGSLTVASIMRANDVPNLPEGRIWIGDGNTIVSDTVYVDEPNGRVGIGTTSPYAKLHVASANGSDTPTAGTATGGLFVSNTNKTYGINMGVSGSGWSFIQSQRADGDTTLYSLNLQPLGGNVGIGTTIPSQKLEVAGEVLIKNNTLSYLYLNNTSNFLYGDTYGNTIIRSSNNFRIQTKTGGGESVRVTSAGNVGIGTTNPGEKLTVAGNISITSPNSFLVKNGDSNHGLKYGYNTFASNPTDGPILYGYDAGGLGTKRSSENIALYWNYLGNVGIGTTNPTQKLHVVGRVASTAGQGFQIINSYGSPWLSDFYGSFTTSSPLYVGGPYSGQACYASAFNITSDYRLKENEVPLTEASSRIKKLKPIRFNYISSENTVDGFLAHEVGEVIPEAVTGEKDAVREDGSNELQGLDLSKIVPLLTAALQETITKIEQLEQRIKTLENK